MKIVHDIAEMKRLVKGYKSAGETLVLVPTMGYLHDGHLRLMKEGKALGKRLVISIFVNPTQFGPGEDFERYPRNIERDERLAEKVGVDAIFYPTEEAMYPPGYRTYVEVVDWDKMLCGRSRPSHFRGVCTVVLKLFNIIQPDVAVFGWKDAQQFIILRRMVKDFNLDITMVGVETVREPDGLAMSSRNQYLSKEQRTAATILHQALTRAQTMVKEGEKDVAILVETMKRMIEEKPETRIDYIEAVSIDELEPLEKVQTGNTLIALAVFVGPARLIDNIRL